MVKIMRDSIWPRDVAVELDYIGVTTDVVSAGTLPWQQATRIYKILKKGVG